MKKNILVAGGAGFVGSHLCKALINDSNFVVVLDNLSTGNKHNLSGLLKHKNFKFIKADVTNKLLINKIFTEIYHLASPASPPYYQKKPIETWKANTLGTLNLLELARKQKAKFLFASTSEVYGDPLVHPQKESYFGNVNPVGVRSCYDESKRAGESLCMDYFREYKLNIKIARIFNTYGPHMDKSDGRVVSNFILQALKNKSLSIYGTGKQTRSFMYIDDLVVGLTKLMGADVVGPVNLGNPNESTILEIGAKILNLTQSTSKFTHSKLPLDDPKQRRPDITQAKQKLKWKPTVDLEQGLRLTIKYFTENI